jgi:ABC-type sugar transport system substrate-binding protein
MVPRSRKIPLAITAAAACLGLAACSSGSSSAPSTSGTSSSPVGSASQAAATSGTSGATSTACSAKVGALLQSATAANTLTVGPKINAKSLAGKNIWIIGIDNAQQVIADIQSGVDAGAGAVGIKVTNFDAQGSASNAAKGVAEAVAANASAIIIDAVATADIGGPLAQAKAKGIPVISAYEASATPGLLYNVVQPRNAEDGAYQGAEALALTNCQPNALYINSPVFSAQQQFAAGAKAEISKVCGSSCTATTVTYDPSTLATQVGPEVQNALQRNPAINVVIAGTDDVAIVAVPAIQKLESKAVLIGESGETASLKMVQGKEVELADVSNPSNEVTGWMLVDQAIRAMLHDPPAPQDYIRSRLVTADNVGDGSLSNLFPNFVNYQSAYKADWSVG